MVSLRQSSNQGFIHNLIVVSTCPIIVVLTNHQENSDGGQGVPKVGPLDLQREDEVNCMIKPSALLPKGK